MQIGVAYDDMAIHHKENGVLIGYTEVVMPESEWEEVELPVMAGITGKVKIPIPGHNNAMVMEIKVPFNSPEYVALATTGTQELDLRTHQHVVDGLEQKQIPIRYFVSVLYLGGGLGGTIKPQGQLDTTLKFSVLKMEHYISGELVKEISQINRIDKTGETDHLKAINDFTKKEG